MVITVLAPDAPGTTVGGAKVAVAPAGRPEADMVTTLSKDPPRGGTMISMSTDPPALTVNGLAGAVTPKVVATYGPLRPKRTAQTALPE